MTNPTLFDGPQLELPAELNDRLGQQIVRVYAVLLSGESYTLDGLSEACRRRFGSSDPPASVSARLRDLRKPRWGGHTIERQLIGRGLHAYRMIPSELGLLNGDRDAPGPSHAGVTCPMCGGRGRLNPADLGGHDANVVQRSASSPTEGAEREC